MPENDLVSKRYKGCICMLSSYGSMNIIIIMRELKLSSVFLASVICFQSNSIEGLQFKCMQEQDLQLTRN